jgi:hypothetical protein
VLARLYPPPAFLVLASCFSPVFLLLYRLFFEARLAASAKGPPDRGLGKNRENRRTNYRKQESPNMTKNLLRATRIAIGGGMVRRRKCWCPACLPAHQGLALIGRRALL